MTKKELRQYCVDTIASNLNYDNITSDKELTLNNNSIQYQEESGVIVEIIITVKTYEA